jgi:hypothetical protein
MKKLFGLLFLLLITFDIFCQSFSGQLATSVNLVGINSEKGYSRIKMHYWSSPL